MAPNFMDDTWMWSDLLVKRRKKRRPPQPDVNNVSLEEIKTDMAATPLSRSLQSQKHLIGTTAGQESGGRGEIQLG